MSDSGNGRVLANITGSNYTGSNELTPNVNGVWDTTETIISSNNAQYILGQVVTAVDNIFLTGNHIDKYNSTTGLTITGCLNGSLMFVSKVYDASGWHHKYVEIMMVNAAGNYMVGKSQQISTAPPSYNSNITMDVVRTKRP